MVFGKASADVTPEFSDVDLPEKVRYVVVTSPGTLKVVALDSNDADAISFGICPIGFIVPFRVRKIFQNGTTAKVASII